MRNNKSFISNKAVFAALFFFTLVPLAFAQAPIKKTGSIEYVSKHDLEFFTNLKLGQKVEFIQHCDPSMPELFTDGMVSYSNGMYKGDKCRFQLHFEDTVLVELRIWFRKSANECAKLLGGVDFQKRKLLDEEKGLFWNKDVDSKIFDRSWGWWEVRYRWK